MTENEFILADRLGVIRDTIHKHGTCKLKNMIYDLCKSPSEWDVDKIEREFNA